MGLRGGGRRARPVVEALGGGGSRFVAHSGDTIGQNSTLWMVPKDDFAFVLLTNADRGGLVCEELAVRSGASCWA